jgi:hypothetical protein
MQRKSILIYTAVILFLLGTGCKSCHRPPDQGRLFGITSCCPNDLTEIDPVAGTLNNQLEVGGMGFGFPVGATAVDSGSDIFYVVRHTAGVPRVMSIEINSATFLESPPLSSSLLALGYDSNAGQLFGVTSCCPNEFVHVDMNSGTLTSLASIGDMGFAFVAGASAIDAATNRFFMIRHTAGVPHLIAIDTNTGALTETPALSTGIMKLGFDEDDNVLAAVTSCCPNQFGHLDTTTGAFTAIADVGDMGFGFSAGASAVDSGGNRLFLARSQAGVPHVISVDTLTGAITESPALAENLLSLGFDGP